MGCVDLVLGCAGCRGVGVRSAAYTRIPRTTPVKGARSTGPGHGDHAGGKGERSTKMLYQAFVTISIILRFIHFL